MQRRAAALASRLDELEVPHGARVAIVSPNSARFLISFFGVSGYGRILVPINFRLNAAEIAYIVEHSGAEVVLYDPELAELVAGRRRRAHSCALDGDDDAAWFAERRRSARAAPRGARTRTRRARSTTRRARRRNPKGVQLTHRNCWLNAASFGWHLGVQRPRRAAAHAADVPRERLGHAVRGDRDGARATSCCARSTARRSSRASSARASRSCAARRPSSR